MKKGKIKNGEKINYAYYIVCDKFLGLVSFGVPLNAGKQEACNRLGLD